MKKINFEKIENVELVELEDNYIFEYTERLVYSFDNFKTNVYKVVDKREFFNNIDDVYVTENDLDVYVNIDFIYICIQLDNNIYLINYKNRYYSLVQSIFDNNKNDLLEYEEKEEKPKDFSSFLAIRWAGAYNTETVNNYDFEKSLQFEFNCKDREVACDLFENSQASGINNIIYRCLQQCDYLYKKCKLAFIYNSDNVVNAYSGDVWSANIGNKLIATGENYNNEFELNAKDDNIYCYKYHCEAFLRVGAKPTSVIIINKQYWSKEKLILVENYSKKFNLSVIYIDYDYNDYNDNYYKLSQNCYFNEELKDNFNEETMFDDNDYCYYSKYLTKDFYKINQRNMNLHYYTNDLEFEKEYNKYYKDYEKIDRLY